jgi:hypothetical protein
VPQTASAELAITGENVRVRLLVQHGANVLFANPSARDFGPKSLFRHVGLSAENLRRLHHRVLKRQMLKSVQCVVVYKNADGPLGGQQMRQVIHGMAQLLPLAFGRRRK